MKFQILSTKIPFFVDSLPSPIAQSYPIDTEEMSFRNLNFFNYMNLQFEDRFMVIFRWISV